MRRFHLLLVLCLLTSLSWAQKNELRFKAGTGLFFFSGSGTQGNVTPFQTLYFENFATNSYGTKPGLSITAGASAQRVTRHNIIFGLEAGFQYLEAKSKIDAIYLTSSGFSSLIQRVDVQGGLTYGSTFINLAPFAGKRFKLGNTSLDLTAGPEVGLRLKATEEIQLDGDTNYPFEKKRKIESKKADLRLQAQVQINIHRLSIYAGYARGLTNYYGQYIGGTQPEAYSRFLRIGITARL